MKPSRNANKTMPTDKSHPGLLDGGVALDAILPNDQKPIVQPGITFKIFRCTDETTGEDEICLVVDEQGYAEYEQRAQKNQMTVDAFAYASLAEKLKSYGFNISPDAFYVTTTLPDIGFMGKPPAIKRTLN